MRKIKKIFEDKSFIKAVISLTSGSFFAQTLTILASPLLTRIFSPQELGVYTLVLTAEGLFAGIICGRYDVSIVYEQDENKVFALIKSSSLITFFLSLIISISYGSYYFIFNEEYSSYWYAIVFIFFMLLFNGLNRILEAYNNRKKEYKVITTVYIIKTLIQNVGSVALGLLKLSVLGLLFSHTIGLLGGLKKQAKTISLHINKIRSVKNNEMKEVLRDHFRQPLYSAPANFANKFSYTSILVFIESLFGLAVLGFYSISYKALGLPLTVISNNVAKVFFQEASSEFNLTGRFYRSFNKISVFLLFISIPMVVVLFFFSPKVFELVFGEKWKEAGVYVQILAPMFGVRFIVNTVAYGLQIVKKQHLELILQFLFIFASTGGYIFTKISYLNVNQFLLIISISFSIIYFLYFIVIMYYAYTNNSEKN
ncbi:MULTISPECIES: lipopolysaccharide biosynthesis protein [Clostridia]|uniref:lipopolysaccharide biosynthesis protein n=1 Tax=Clostridia TaxID=186801 RepID=UPI000EA08ED9|nr:MULTISPECIES: lipopolysaccharide biosynthesis protein [Clostridia]NBJ70850.1 lipopolysaccharide biosynthesis protein [Roseburia sp. 1XD42-34]RKI75711.1 lipopolysaccharide biosynthesis protein [Clostridium sp. 1xD42-85]